MVTSKLSNREATQRGTLPVVEALPPRTMMSASPLNIAHPDFVIGHRESAPLGVHHAKGAVHPGDMTPTGFTPAQIRQAYGINKIQFGSVTGNGYGQTITIVDAYDDPNALADLKTFDRTFGLPDPWFDKLNQYGGKSLPGVDPNQGTLSSWSLETSLDIQWAHAVAPHAAIILIEANSSSNSDLNAAINTARNLKNASVVSMSFGGSEWSTESQNNYLYTTPAGHNGVTFLASTGDNGAYGGPADSQGNNTLGTSDPSTSPNVVAVGGTSLYADSSGNYHGESAWKGSGGGVSRYQSEPAYQKALVTNTYGMRGVPDLSNLADPNTGVSIVDSEDLGSASPWITMGGTSLACPMTAGLIAIADQGRVLAGHGTLDGPSQTLPAIYSLPSSDFNDITTGNNGYYSAGRGYDLVTGRGTPRANLFVAGLANYGVSSAPTPTPTPTVKGTIGGEVYWDLFGDGVPHNGFGLSNVTVYVDLNHDGRFDKGDVSCITNANGQFGFINAPAGNYSIGVVAPQGFYCTTPSMVTVGILTSKLNVTGVDFGLDVT